MPTLVDGDTNVLGGGLFGFEKDAVVLCERKEGKRDGRREGGREDVK